MKTASVVALLCLLLPGAASSGTLTPGLRAQLDRLGEDDVVRVLVVLADRVDLPALDRELRADKAATGERHRRVLGALQDVAAGSQADLLTSLGADKAGGRVLGYTPHWLVNSVVVSATVGAVRELAGRPDVERIEPDLAVELIEPLPGEGPVPAAKAAAGVGTTPGVAAINAPRVWQELGIDGTGVVVGILDTGVDGFHPALAARWRGNFAPAAECWLDAAGLGDASFPVDRHFHGTHVMGTLTGLAPGDTIGVAPGARWIAANVINHPGPLEAFDNAVIASLEFMADPDGDPTTTADVPAVVQNSWGVRADYEEFFPCDSRWWDAIDALETAGVVVVWAAGNEGPGPGTLRSPADRASSPLNAFSVGSTLTYPPHALSGFSSRGPSLCGGPHQIKPEVVAPGSNIYSAQPGGGYRYLSGTSMAGPHVAGVVALMRAASPDADVAAIKQALMDTAVDLPPAGEDNGSGWGMVDAYAAVMAVKAGVGEIAGSVTDADTGQPLAGAAVRIAGGVHDAVSGADGAFRLVLPAGPATITVAAFGFTDGRLDVTVPDGGAVAGDIALAPRPWAAVSGRVTGPDGQPVPGAVITADDTPLEPALADVAGVFSLALPAGPGLGYNLRARAAGFGSTLAFVRVEGPATRDFILPPAAVEDFESAGFATYAWQRHGDAPWTIDQSVAWEGSHSARSGALGGNGISRLELTYATLDPGDLVFRCRVSSEAGYDFLRFYVDGIPQAAWSGEETWAESRHALPAGSHVLTWSYEKDESVDGGEDAAWLDLIEFPAQATPPHPVLQAVPAEIAVVVPPGGSTVAALLLGNAGSADLVFSASTFSSPAKAVAGAASVPHAAAAKAAPDDRPAVDRAAGSGGPDRFGYGWRDSDDPFGPDYAWIDIAADGTSVTLGDDDNVGPFDLGFAFPFYGEQFDRVRIASNGFLSFTSTSVAWANQGIPDAAPPNHLLAVFWDDLSPDIGGRVSFRADPGRFIVQYQDVPHFGVPGLTETFQVILAADGAITYQYASVGDDGSCTVGIENGAGDDGLLVQFNAAGSLRDGLALRFRAEPASPWLRVDPASGVVSPADERQLAVTVDASGLAPGDYEAFLNLASNDPEHGVVLVPVRVTVREPAGSTPGVPGGVVLAGAVPNPFNPKTEIRFALPAAAQVSLRVYDVAGRLVRELVEARLPAGPHRVPWDGRDGGGRGVASGTYMARLVVDGVPHVRAMTLLR